MGSQRLKEDNYWFKLAVTLIHLALWAELGVITRTFLDKFLLLGCSGGWGPCLQGEAGGGGSDAAGANAKRLAGLRAVLLRGE